MKLAGYNDLYISAGRRVQGNLQNLMNVGLVERYLWAVIALFTSIKYDILDT